jgi:lambda repressor-like predicted transcriptional regulator
MIGINAQQNARAKVHVTHERSKWQSETMRDWALDYILHVMQAKNWSANRLAIEASVASSTIARPLRQSDWPHKISRTTIAKVYEASGIDPNGFIPDGMAEDKALFSGPPPGTNAPRFFAEMVANQPMATIEFGRPTFTKVNEIKIEVVGAWAQIVATVDRSGIGRLRAKLDAIESMLDD